MPFKKIADKDLNKKKIPKQENMNICLNKKLF